MLSLICNLASAVVGALIPVFYSYKTIKRPSQKTLSYWSKYWAVFGSFLAVDVILSALFIHYFLPFYELGKLLFLIWAVCPQTAGAQFIFDKMLAPFIRRHEKKMDIYVERVVANVVTRGPDLALTAGVTLFNVAKNLHALSQAKPDSQGRLCFPVEQSMLNIAEIDDEHEEVEEPQPERIQELPLQKALVAIPPPTVEVKPELILPSDDEVVYVPVYQQREESKSASTSKTPLPAKRRRGRRTGSGVTPRRRKQPNAAQVANEEPKVVEEVVEAKPVRPSSRGRITRAAANAARKKLIIVGADDTVSEA